MGCYNTVVVDCPRCGYDNHIQTKAGTRVLSIKPIGNADLADIVDVRDRSPHICQYGECDHEINVGVTREVHVY